MESTTSTSIPVQPITDPSKKMRATMWFGKKDIRIADAGKPLVTHPNDAVIKVTTSTICGSDLHFYHNAIPGMEKGDILGHECMGIVESVGENVQKVKLGQRVVVSAVIADGTCQYCKKGMFSLCDTTNPSGELATLLGGQKTAGLFGYSHLTGGFPGGQAEFIRVPYADVNCLPIPDDLPDEKVIFLSDVLCTSWHANELGKVGEGSTVAIWGCGPIGLASAMWAKHRGASCIVVIDCITDRLELAQTLFGCHVIDFNEEEPGKRLLELVPGGPQVSIDAVGFRYSKSWTHTIEKLLMMETDAIDSVTEAIYATAKGGRVILIGDYLGTTNHFPIGAVMEKGLTLTGSQVFVQKYWHHLLEKIKKGEIDPSFLITKETSLENVSDAYRQFDEKAHVLKILLKPEHQYEKQ